MYLITVSNYVYYVIFLNYIVFLIVLEIKHITLFKVRDIFVS